MNTNKHISLYLLTGLILVLIISFINFQLIPIAWLDEIMDLDTAANLIHGRGFTSLVWPYENTSNIFVATLPVRDLPHIIATFIGGADYHWIRTFFFLLFVSFVFFSFRLFRAYFSSPVVLILLLFFITDKGVYESIRSVRPEIIQLILLCLGIWFINIKKLPYLALLSQSLLFLTHPSSWFLSACISLYALIQLKQCRKIILGILLFCLPTLIWLWLFDFPFEDIRNQFLIAGDQHSATGSIVEKFKNHFWDRYLPQYMAQPWVWMMYLLVHFLSIRIIILNLKQKTMPDLWSLLFLGHSLFWFFALAPHARYNPTTLFLTYFIFTRFILNTTQFQNLKFKAVLISLIFFIHSLPFAGISFLAMTQYPERIPKPVFDWLDENIELKPGTLIGGESIAAYWTYKYSGSATYFEPIYPQHIHFQQYNQIYLLSRATLPYKKLSDYKSNRCNYSWIQYLHNKSGSYTYKGLKLYKLSPGEAEDFCLKTRNNKDWEKFYMKK